MRKLQLEEKLEEIAELKKEVQEFEAKDEQA